MPTNEMLWTIDEQHRRAADEAALEREARRRGSGRSSMSGRLVGWIRERLRRPGRGVPGSVELTAAR